MLTAAFILGTLAIAPPELTARIVEMANPQRLRETHVQLADHIHVAGTPGDRVTIERLSGMFRDAGLEVEVHAIWPLLCSPVSASLSVTVPQEIKLDIAERVLPEDKDSGGSAFGWNAYSASGVASGAVVYANYATRQDFAKLRELGIDCTGKIIIAKYGGNYRGYKVKFAQEAGAAGVIIFTDPADGGFTKGPVYPVGSYANDCCIQRGSILTLPYQGDPLTPGREASEHASRDDVASTPLPKIPCQPIGYGAAKEILSRMSGVAAPKEWQGGLGFDYRITSDGETQGVRVRLEVQQKREVMQTANVLGMIRGTEHPEQLVILGAHHDAWNHGAADPSCGTITVVEAARIFGELAKAGIKPRRTLVFATWAAEEFGIIGSTEWVEANQARLKSGCVAYINLDMASMGPQFGASATPSLYRAIMDAAKVVPQAGDATRTVYQDWAARSTLVPGRGLVPSCGDIGGGSDHVAFLCRAGVACAGFGSGGSAGTSYHSAYDTLPWYWKTVGSDYESAMMVTRMAAVTAASFAFDPQPAVSPSEYAHTGVASLVKAEKAAREAGLSTDGFEPLRADLVECALLLREHAADLASSMAIDRAWLAPDSESGLERRGWYRNLFAAPDENSGYDAWVFPLIRAAIEQRDQAALTSACVRTRERIAAVMSSIRSR
jgi:N-acetylated-alpha-linked acidic dipeptidase